MCGICGEIFFDDQPVSPYQKKLMASIGKSTYVIHKKTTSDATIKYLLTSRLF